MDVLVSRWVGHQQRKEWVTGYQGKQRCLLQFEGFFVGSPGPRPLSDYVHTGTDHKVHNPQGHGLSFPEHLISLACDPRPVCRGKKGSEVGGFSWVTERNMKLALVCGLGGGSARACGIHATEVGPTLQAGRAQTR